MHWLKAKCKNTIYNARISRGCVKWILLLQEYYRENHSMNEKRNANIYRMFPQIQVQNLPQTTGGMILVGSEKKVQD